MSAEQVPQGTAVDSPAARKTRSRSRLVGIDAARGLALIGLMAIHLFPSENEETHEPTLAWTLFSGDSAALFALLAGVGLALSSGGARAHRGRQMTADRAGLVVRAALVGAVGLVVAAILPWDPPAYSILLYYAAFFLLAIPFLHLGPKVLFGSAAVFGLLAPVLMQQLGPVLPESSDYNHTLMTLLTEPVAVASELLLTGSYPALPYMTCLLVGLGLGRLDLRSTRVQGLIAGAGAGLTVLANLVSALLLYVAGGYQALLATEEMTRDTLDEALVYGPDILPDTSGWWLAIATPHTNTPLALAASLGMALLVLGVFLLLAPKAGRWLKPLAAMGTLTLTIYTVHLIALAPEVHYEEPALWFVLHLGIAAVFAWFWTRHVGKGPLEGAVHRAVTSVRGAVADQTASVTAGAPTGGAADRPGSGPDRH
ncbi:heparan-alpha-glucosaminide N-acetyltransferase domain-containing protein [Micrococcus terreus]|uniref:heparan-alpha-glucosaminide N-acetyltransferase domain-containing protein n=1 Tax=Micrococcus terreus TaxID=574650 RepID=UPI0033D3F065